MHKFRYVSHTADMAFVGYGSTFKMAIENCALALLNVMLDLKSISKEGKEHAINISEFASTNEDLVWFVLQDVLSKVDTLKLNASSFKITNIKQTKKGLSLNGRLLYKKLKKDYSLLSVKAVTPHDLKVEKKNGIYSIYVVIDV